MERERERGSRHTADGTHRLAEKSHLERQIPSVGLDFPKPAQQRLLNFTLAQNNVALATAWPADWGKRARERVLLCTELCILPAHAVRLRQGLREGM